MSEQIFKNESLEAIKHETGTLRLITKAEIWPLFEKKHGKHWGGGASK